MRGYVWTPWSKQKHGHIHFQQDINSRQWYARTHLAVSVSERESEFECGKQRRTENMAKVGKYRRCGRTKGFGSSPQRASTIFYKSGSHQRSPVRMDSGGVSVHSLTKLPMCGPLWLYRLRGCPECVYAVLGICEMVIIQPGDIARRW